MKFNKIYSVFAAAVAVLGASSCSEVTEPQFKTPDSKNTNFAIYAPAFQNDVYELSMDGTFQVELSEQPDYGFSAVTQYRLDVCLDDKFEEGKYTTLVPLGSGTLLSLTLRDSDLAAALTAFQGATTLGDYVDQGLQKVYLRGRAFIEGVEGSEFVTKNVETLNNVRSFFYVPRPGVIYLIGNYRSDWIAPMPENEAALLEFALSEREDAVGSKVYYGTVDFQSNAPIFRFYTELGSWDDNSWGCANLDAEPTSDNPQAFEEFTGAAGTSFEHALQNTKDSFSFPNCPGGVLNFVVDMSDKAKVRMTVTPAE